ncbi:MAG: sigma-54 dependent transcriptional regulator [Desulfohalobiaceae bacterium]|nr:sigma-54 dependent transcriptional regulator [Desulfohalobiaceae bacterium]
MDQKGEPRILIIDDDEQLCRLLQDITARMGLSADSENTLAQGVQKNRSQEYAVVLLDVHLPDGNGLEIIPQLREVSFPPEIIIMTGYGDQAGAEIAMENNAWDYLMKGSSFQNIKLALQRALQYREQKKKAIDNLRLHQGSIIGESPQIRACLKQAARAASTDIPVLITGETGTGKELFAKAIHDNSHRCERPFVVVDCAALPEHLVESTLFGHTKGAFTGADAAQEGLVKQANTGTLFLDEIGDLPLTTQTKFLRVLQEKRFRPLGSKQEVGSDFRLICATNRNLNELVEAGGFRQDLYFRIGSLSIELPPLRQREGDIRVLVKDFLRRRCRQDSGCPHTSSQDFLDALKAYHWPGNVRELFNVLDSVHLEAQHETVLFVKHLPQHIRTQAVKSKLPDEAGDQGLPSPSGSTSQSGSFKPLKEHLDEMRLHYIKGLMELTSGDIAEACRISKLSRGHLYELLKKYEIR